MQKTQKYVTQQYTVGIAIIALLSTIAYLFLSYIILTQEMYSELIQISSRQSMLSQRIAFFSNRLANSSNEQIFNHNKEQLHNALVLMETSHKRLLDSHSATTNTSYMSSELKTIYYDSPHDLDNRVNSFISHGKALLNLTEQEIQSDTFHLPDIVESSISPLLKSLNIAASQYETDAKAQAAFLRRMQTVFWILTLIILLLEVRFLFIPMTERVFRHIKSLSDEIEKINTALKVRTQFLANISHDLMTPINSIKEFCNELIKKHMESFTHNEQKALRLINTNTNTLTGRLENLLNLSYMEDNKNEHLYVKFDIQETLDDLISRTNNNHEDLHNIHFVRNNTEPIFIIAHQRDIEIALEYLIQKIFQLHHSRQLTISCCMAYIDKHFSALVHFYLDCNITEAQDLFKRLMVKMDTQAEQITGFDFELSIAQKIISDHSGAISLKFDKSDNTLLEVILPLGYETSNTPPIDAAA